MDSSLKSSAKDAARKLGYFSLQEFVRTKLIELVKEQNLSAKESAQKLTPEELMQKLEDESRF